VYVAGMTPSSSATTIKTGSATTTADG